jgi:hypothetical protein
MLGIEASHFESHRRKQLCSDELLREVVSRSKTCTEVLQAIGVELHSNHFYRLRRRIRSLGLDTSHFLRKRSGRDGPRRRWSDDDLRRAVLMSKTHADTLRRLGLVPAGGNYALVQRRVRELALDTSHFVGKGWNVQGKFIRPIARPLAEVLVADRPAASHHLKWRLIRAGLKAAACEECGWAERRPLDGGIPLELDHRNGNRNDNRLENLRILCPNCHSLQPTHRGLNQQRRKR